MDNSENLLEHLSFDSLVDHYNELLVSNYWTFKVTKWAAAAYHPNEQLLQIRFKSITGLPEPRPTILEYKVRGYDSYQTGSTTVPIGDISMGFVDYEDSSLLFWARSWRDSQHYWAKYVANRLEYCVSEFKLYRCNKEGRAVRTYTLKRSLLSNIQYSDDFTEDSRLIGDEASIEVKALVKSEMLNYNAT